MSKLRVLIYVQHLLGIGHLMRAMALARAFDAQGFAVNLVSGGMPVSISGIGGIRLDQLPPVRSSDQSFTTLVDEAGEPIDDSFRADRRDILLTLFAERRPDVLILEMFPFGRRQMRFELTPLLEAARKANPRPLIVSSVRDILQRTKPGRAEEAVASVEANFDLVLVHGDPSLVPFAASFPLAHMITERLHHTGYIAGPPVLRGQAGSPGWGEVVVSAGGGAVGENLIEAALGARPQTRLAGFPWRFLIGRNMAEDTFSRLKGKASRLKGKAAPGVIIERARPDFAILLANCRISISQAGYNTVMDAMNAGARAVLVPFVGIAETEQSMRAERLAARGLASLVPERELSALRLAQAIDYADTMPRPDFSAINRHGAETSVRLVREAMTTSHGRTASAR